MKKILNKTSVKLQENTNKMEEVKMATEKQQKRYQWTKGDRFGDIVTVAEDQQDGKWLYFDDGSRINPNLIDEFLLEVRNDREVLDVNSTQPAVQNQPEVAVPVLVEVVRLMTPASSEGQKAYQSLIELGFVETPFAGAKSAK